jgi:hypothetical protein
LLRTAALAGDFNDGISIAIANDTRGAAVIREQWFSALQAKLMASAGASGFNTTS